MTAWFWIPLRCVLCDRVTYRPPRSVRPCRWCELDGKRGELTA